MVYDNDFVHMEYNNRFTKYATNILNSIITPFETSLKSTDL